MKPETIHVGTTVRVREHHSIAERRGMVGTIVDHYGGDGYVVVDVRFSDRLRWLLWPEDLEEINVCVLRHEDDNGKAYRWVWDVEDLHLGDKVVKDHFCDDDHNGNGDRNGNEG